MDAVYDRTAYLGAISDLFGSALPFHNWSYPPSALAILSPFAAPPYFIALALWSGLTLLAYLAVGLAPVPRNRRLSGAMLLAFSPASLINIVGGQNGFLTAALLLGAFQLMPRSPLRAGGLLGLLTIKPHLALVAPFLMIVARAWRAIAAALLVALVLVIVSAALFGIEPWRAYLTDTSRYTVDALERFTGFFPLMMGSVYTSFRSSGASSSMAWLAQVLVSVMTLGAAVLAFRKTSSPVLRIQIAAAAAPLMTPYIFFYDLTALSGVLVWRMLDDGPGRPSSGLKAIYVFAWMAPCVLLYLNVVGIGATALVLAAVFGATMMEAYGWRSREDSNFRPSV
ncbi:hypothetical protein GCM10007036_23160 [Alsobacter metallidurans]|uniref:DUF2029 domain-containing protein n=2 Tax=Alsobacter metallidurans TaxID=340221 RepID=A0A917MHZ6_9HYPH|nr:hypothetical protein GCM10007036_23160 [Alsobacter metallidurans]